MRLPQVSSKTAMVRRAPILGGLFTKGLRSLA